MNLVIVRLAVAGKAIAGDNAHIAYLGIIAQKLLRTPACMRAKTFAQLYCEAHALSPEEFAPVVLKRSLYPHARLFGWLVTLFNRRHFEADYDFVHDAGRLMRFRDFDLAVAEFAYHPGNSGFLRRALRVRVSSQRLRRLVRDTLHSRAAGEPPHDDAGTQVPFSNPNKPTEDNGRAPSKA